MMGGNLLANQQPFLLQQAIHKYKFTTRVGLPKYQLAYHTNKEPFIHSTYVNS